jgi:hypothetical protein
MATENLLPAELNEVLNSPEFDDDSGLLIQSLKFIEESLVITFAIKYLEDKEMPDELWNIIVNGIEEECVKTNWTQDINIYKSHALLLEYTDIHTELYFRRTTNRSQELFIDIFNSIRRLSKDKTFISKYIFSPVSIDKLSRQDYGLFARGPKTILKLYAECLSKYGIKPIFIGEYAKQKPLKLLIFGDSYFIGENFLFEKLVSKND